MSVKAKLYDLKGEAKGETSLPEDIFGIRPNPEALFDTVLAQQAAHRQGSAKTKTRSEVRGGGKKPYKQKGTGNARQGSTRSPVLVGGGKAFGPRPRKYDYVLPKKVRSLALRSALSQAQRDGKIFVVKSFEVKEPKTETVLGFFEGLKISKALVVDFGNENLFRSVRNIKTAKYLEAKGLNVRDILKYENVVLTSTAVEKIQERLA